MRMLVTGGLGFIGMNFINYWLEKYDDEIINLDKQTYAANNPNYFKNVDSNKYTFVKGDISDPALVNRLAGDVDIIVNLAAESHVDNSISNSSQFVLTNVLGTQVMLEATRKYDIRLHHISTDEVFGALDPSGDHTFDENTCYAPKNPYSATKAAADHLVDAYVNTYGIRATISNCSNNFGPFQHIEKLIPKSINRILAGEKIQLYGNGKQIRDWIYVEDHCEAIDLILKKGKIGEHYLVGARNEKTNFEVVNELMQLMGRDQKEQIEFITDRPGHDLRYAIDPVKIEKELGWKPKHNFHDSLIRTVDFYKKTNIK